MATKRSFFERLTGSLSHDEFDDDLTPHHDEPKLVQAPHLYTQDQGFDEEPTVGELPIDMFHTNTEVVIKALVAGVKPEDLEISITRDSVELKGKRVSQADSPEQEHLARELYWGAFARSVHLPSEIDIDLAEARQEQGLLTIRLPKVNKDRQTKVKVKGL